MESLGFVDPLFCAEEILFCVDTQKCMSQGTSSYP